MATVKVASLVIRTLAKPISTKLKQQAQEHERFRNICINIAQSLHRNEMRMRVNLLGETNSSGGKPNIRALSESRAIATGANFLSEGFLFAVAVSLIMAESYRGYRKESARRDLVSERLDSLEAAVQQMQEQQGQVLQEIRNSTTQSANVMKILDGVIDFGMRNGEMRRILTHDKDVAKALDNIGRSQSATTGARPAPNVSTKATAVSGPSGASQIQSTEDVAIAMPRAEWTSNVNPPQP